MDLIVKLDAQKQFIHIIDENTEKWELVDNINDASLFSENDMDLYPETIMHYLHRVREEDKENNYVVQRVHNNILNQPLKYVIQLKKRKEI